MNDEDQIIEAWVNFMADAGNALANQGIELVANGKGEEFLKWTDNLSHRENVLTIQALIAYILQLHEGDDIGAVRIP